MWYRVKANTRAYDVARALDRAGHAVVCFGVESSAAALDLYVEGHYIKTGEEVPPQVAERYGLEAVPWFEPGYCAIPGWRRSFSGANVFPHWVLAYCGQYRWSPGGEEYTPWSERRMVTEK